MVAGYVWRTIDQEVMAEVMANVNPTFIHKHLYQHWDNHLWLELLDLLELESSPFWEPH